VLRQNQDLLKTERESRLAAADLMQAADTESQLRDSLQSAVLDFATSLPVRAREILIQCLVRSGMLPRQPKAQAAPQQLQQIRDGFFCAPRLRGDGSSLPSLAASFAQVLFST